VYHIQNYGDGLVCSWLSEHYQETMGGNPAEVEAGYARAVKSPRARFPALGIHHKDKVTATYYSGGPIVESKRQGCTFFPIRERKIRDPGMAMSDEVGES
jgi:hypothetical protein